jgi:hypothetical protein
MDNRTVYCPHCEKPAKLARAVNSGRVGFTCRDVRCIGARSFIDESATPAAPGVASAS